MDSTPASEADAGAQPSQSVSIVGRQEENPMTTIGKRLALAAVVLTLATPVVAQTTDAAPDRTGRSSADSAPRAAPPGAANKASDNAECAGQFGHASDGMIKDNVGTRRPCF
jgi:hypothetical protein